MYFEERHKNHQKNGYFLCFLTNTKIIRSQRRFFVCIFSENPPLFFQTGFDRRFLAPVFVAQADVARPPSFLFCTPDVKLLSFIGNVSYGQPRYNVVLPAAKKESAKLKKNLLHFFALIFVQKISFSPPSEDRCLALQVKPRLRAGAFTRAKKFILFSSARQAKSFLFNFYAPRYCSADLDYARSRFGISNSLSVFTTNVLLPGESFLLASGFCSNFPRRCVSRRFFILNAAYFLS